MELRAEGLAFSVMFTTPDAGGWMYCNAIIDVPNFRGDLDFHMLLDDLDRFLDELSRSLDAANWPCDVRLASAEPGIDLAFRVEGTGQVEGEYSFGGRGSYRPSLSGAYRMDQTFLAPLLAQLTRMRGELA